MERRRHGQRSRRYRLRRLEAAYQARTDPDQLPRAGREPPNGRRRRGLVTLALGEISAQGRGASTDVIEASIKAYVNAINRLHHGGFEGMTLDGNDLGPGDPVQEVR